MADHIEIVLQVNPQTPDATFVEIEADGKSVKIGKWIKRPDGWWVIRIGKDEIEALNL